MEIHLFYLSPQQHDTEDNDIYRNNLVGKLLHISDSTGK